MSVSASNRRVVWAALHMSNLLRDWPEMTFEDALALSRTMGWGFRGYRQGMSTSGPESPVSRGRISKRDLHTAWELAHDMVKTAD